MPGPSIALLQRVAVCSLAGWMAAMGVARGQSSSADLVRIEPPGPCSRRTPLVISEIFYHPPDRADSKNLEFVEIYNSQPWAEDLSGFRLDGAVRFEFGAGTFLAGNGVVVVAGDPEAIRAVYGITNVVGPFAGRLGNGAEEVRLVSAGGGILLEATYAGRAPWPAAADGGGHSLVLARPSLGERQPGAWAASDRVGGSPGELERVSDEPLRSVMFNEILAHSTPPAMDFLELYNHGRAVADLSGCHLTDDPSTNRYTFPPGTVLAAGGFLALTEGALGFALRAEGETVFLINGGGTRVLDALRFWGQARDESLGRYPDGGLGWRPLTWPTPGGSNAPPASPDVVIHEIHYAPLSGSDSDQFVELLNRSTREVDVSGWRLTGGIRFEIPAGTRVEAGGFLVVGRDQARLRVNYPGVPVARLLGDFSGRLSGRGDRVVLTRPEPVLATNAGVVVTNVYAVSVDEVSYGTGGRWPRWAAGGGSSLERVDPRGDAGAPTAWADSDESGKADWTTVEVAGRLDHGDGSWATALEVFLLGAGECLVDDVEVVSGGGQNLLSNPSFESGLFPWVAQGDLETSFVQAAGGVNNSRCLHLRAGGDGDPGANRVRVPLTAWMLPGTDGVLRAKVRWLRGHPEILLRLAGNSLEASGKLSIPLGSGTPGTANSRAVGNAGPDLTDVRHEPILPGPGQPVVVTVRAGDVDGVSQVLMRYRMDPDTNTMVTVRMTDDGQGEDLVAGDGIFSGVIPGQPSGRLVAFHLAATDAGQPTGVRTFPSDAPVRECLVRFGETSPAGRLGVYRLWMTQATMGVWSSRLKLSNAGLDGTFVYGTNRVIYNVQALYAGSAYHAARYTTPTGVACDYKILFPSDDLFLGGDEATLVWPGLTGGDPVDDTGQREQTAYWVGAQLGLPFNYQRYVHFYLNGVRRSFIMQDTQKPDRDSIRQWFPGDDDGELFKVQIWREFDAAEEVTSSIGATLGNFTTVGGAKKTARYRWNWTPRATRGTANSFSNLFALVDAVNTPSNAYTAAVESAIDVEQWMRTFAAEHLAGNWDSYGYGNGQNLYAYKPAGDRWKLMIWDMDVAFSIVGDSATTDLFRLTNPFFPSLNGDPGTVDRLYKHPEFVRAYWRAIREAVDGPLLASRLHPLLDAKAAALAANGVAVAAPTAIKNYLATRRDYCLGRLGTVAAVFTAGTGATSIATNNPAIISGTAPIVVRDILVNGVPVPVTWTSVTSWTARVTLAVGTNRLDVQGLDRLGRPIDTARTTQIIQYVGPPAPAVTVVINEWMAGNAGPGGVPNPVGGAYDDWFELHNPGPMAVDLGGCYLTDDLAFPYQFVVPTGYSVPAGGYLVVWADGVPIRNQSDPGHLHVDFQLAKSGEAIGLFGRDGARIDAVMFGLQTNNVSQGRWPDGEADLVYMTVPSPGAANLWQGLTHAPAFTAIVHEPGGGWALTWRTVAGRRYRLEGTIDLAAPEWLPVGDVQVADASRMTVGIPAESGVRFFRVVEVGAP